MTKQLNEIVRESVSLYKEKLEPISFMVEDEYSETIVIDYYKAKDFLISSQISLLEAELERKKGMIKEYEAPEFPFLETEKSARNELINEDITYLQDQITKCKELIK